MKISSLFGYALVIASALFASNSYALSTELITNPEGERVSYSRDGYDHYPLYGFLINEYYGAYASEIVFGENNTVYILDPLMKSAYGTYIKGTIEGKKAIFELPQPIGVVGKTTLYISRGRYNPDGGPNEMPTYEPDGKNTITFSYVDGVFTMDEDDKVGFALTTADGYWVDKAETKQIYVPFTDSMVEAPEGIPTEEWTINHSSDELDVQIAFSDTQCWVKGVSPNLPNSWIKGDITQNDKGEDIITFKTNQYLGLYLYNRHCYFLTLDLWNLGNGDYSAGPVPSLKFTYDKEAGVMTSPIEYGYGINIGPSSSFGPAEYFLFLGSRCTITKKGANNADINTSEIESENYFDLQGRAVANPASGLYIKVTRYADGTTSASKVKF